MPRRTFEQLSDQDRENLIEMLEFWQWIKGSGKFIQWLAVVALPLAAAIWGIVTWLKKH